MSPISTSVPTRPLPRATLPPGPDGRSQQPRQENFLPYRKRRGWLLILCALLVLLGLVTPTRGLDTKKDVAPAVKSELKTEERQKNIESFEVVWETIRDRHYDPKLGGVNWEGVRDELRPRLEKAGSMDEARAVMNEMLGRLGHSHVGVIPASLYDFGKEGAGGTAVPGFDVRVADGEAVVVRVGEGLPAARAGVRPGWRLRKIDGQDVATVLTEVRDAVKRAAVVPTAQAGALQGRLQGEEGKEVAVTFLDGAGKEVNRTIARARPRGTLVKGGEVPPTYVHFESRKVGNDIAYFYLSDFLDPLRVTRAFGKTVQENLKAEGFVLDLRGNGGGIITMSQGMGSWFVDRSDLKLGTATYRNGTEHIVLNLREATYEGPLAILVDELSVSNSEILAAGLQGLKRARVFGTPTPGLVLPSLFVRLPNGDRFQYVIADYVSTDGKRLEGAGVQPDEVVPVDRKALLEGRDPALDAAVKWIRSQRAGKSK